MTDRVPGVPGQYRGQLTAEAYEKLQAGQPFAITLDRDDQPVVPGTPYSKAAVLPDALAAKLCPEVIDPTPADALSALEAGKLTARQSAQYPGCYYRTADGATEWLEPPLLPGVEYRTARRWGGKPVYAKRVDCGAMPNATVASVGTGISTGCTVVDFQVYAAGVNADGNHMCYSLPHGSTGGSVTQSAWINNFGNQDYYIVLWAATDLSHCAATALLHYTKE